MRVVVDERETVIEFSAGSHPEHLEEYRLIMRRGSWRFLVERLVADEDRSWIKRWEPYGRGRHDGQQVVRHQLDGDVVVCPLPQLLIVEIAVAIQYARTGTLISMREQEIVARA